MASLVMGAVVLLLCGLPAHAQGAAPGVSSYAGQNVSSVEIAGRPDVSFNSVEHLIAVEPNKPLTQQQVDASVAALKQQSGIRDVKVDLQPAAEGVQVTFVLGPAMYVGMYQFPGAVKQFSYTRLLQVANYNAQSPYSANDISQAEDALVQYFRQHGYFKAEVRSQLSEDKEHELVNVLFRTDLGVRARFGKIELAGANPDETAYLHKKLRSVMARLRGDSMKPGMLYSYARLQGATKYLQSALAGQNYIAGNVKLVSAEYDANTNRADINFQVTMGPQVNVATTGTRIWKRTLRDLVPIYAENDVNDELVREGQQNILSYFQKKGYFDAKVDVTQKQTPAGISITYDIHKDGRFKVKQVAFKGNRHFSDKELRDHVSVSKASWLFLSHGTYSQQLVRASVKNLTDTYHAAGFSEATVVPDVTNKDREINISFQVTEGPLTTVRNLTIQGNNTVPEAEFAPHGLNLGAGRAYSQELVAKDRSLIMAHYLTSGYLNVGFRAMARPVPGGSHEMDVVYQISEGPRVMTATVVTDGRQHTRQSLINRQVRITPGQPLSYNAMLSSEGRLYNLDIFDWAEIDPRRPITDQTDEDVVVKVHERKRNSIVYGFGFQVLNRGGAIPSGTVAVPGLPPVGLPNTFKTSQKTFWGPDATFEYTRRNMRGHGETLNFSSFAGRLDQRGALTYTDPYFLGSGWSSSAILTGEHSSQNPIFTDRLGGLGFQLKRPAGKSEIKRKANNVFLRYNFQLTRISNLLIPDLVPANQLNVHLSTLSASFVHDTRDNVLDAHRGLYSNYEVDVSPYWLGSNFSFGQLLMQTAYYKNLHDTGIIWANSIRIGLQQPFNGSEVPLSSKFFAGGGSTLRGFPLDGAGPQQTIPACGNPSDPSTCTKITVPRGGDELLILNSELRFPLNMIKDGLGIVTFYDGGNVFPSIGFHDFTALYSNNVGIGLRYATPVGPVRIDIGRNLNPVPGLKPTQYFITLGQAF
ncbi:MAG TPA: POTRA domain-containing protein [Terriglobales bacterium]|nr:POTRA domain-containing protein [Terriglobales bacterium]